MQLFENFIKGGKHANTPEACYQGDLVNSISFFVLKHVSAYLQC